MKSRQALGVSRAPVSLPTAERFRALCYHEADDSRTQMRGAWRHEFWCNGGISASVLPPPSVHEAFHQMSADRKPAAWGHIKARGAITLWVVGGRGQGRVKGHRGDPGWDGWCWLLRRCCFAGVEGDRFSCSHPLKYFGLKGKSGVKWIWDMFSMMTSLNIHWGAKKHL